MSEAKSGINLTAAPRISLRSSGLQILRRPTSLDAPGSVRLEVPPRQFQIVMGLQIQPKLRAVAKVQAQPKRGIGGDASPIVDDLGNPVRRNPDRFRELVLRETILYKKFVLQHFAGRDRCKFILRHRRLSLMVIHENTGMGSSRLLPASLG